ncbi:MAG TPA: hypothetical protein VF638_03020 [Sphingomonas sp.]|jgi:hypothetical protein
MGADGYPLPWCDELDAPYWQINIGLNINRRGWGEEHAGHSMAEIIPSIDALIEAGEIARIAVAP